jgi:hypothetical protein
MLLARDDTTAYNLEMNLSLFLEICIRVALLFFLTIARGMTIHES